MQVLTLSSREISRQLTEFELDAGLTYLDDETPPGTRRLELYRERYFLLSPADHELAGQDQVEWAAAARLPLCALTSDMRNRRILDANMRAHRAELTPVIEANTVGVLYVRLGCDRLCAIVAHPWLTAFGIPPGMTATAMAPSTVSCAVGLIAADRTRTSVLSDALMEALADTPIREHIEQELSAALSAPPLDT